MYYLHPFLSYLENAESFTWNIAGAKIGLPRMRLIHDIYGICIYLNCKPIEIFQVMYCIVSKAASTYWKRVLVKSSSSRTIGKGDLFRTALSRKYGLVSLASFSKTEIHERLKTYFKFLVVRHPLKRILSAYLNKFEPYGNLSDVHIRFKGYLPFIQKHKYGNSSAVAFSDFVGIHHFRLQHQHLILHRREISQT